VISFICLVGEEEAALEKAALSFSHEDIKLRESNTVLFDAGELVGRLYDLIVEVEFVASLGPQSTAILLCCCVLICESFTFPRTTLSESTSLFLGFFEERTCELLTSGDEISVLLDLRFFAYFSSSHLMLSFKVVEFIGEERSPVIEV
jgi:hypothetical protein